MIRINLSGFLKSKKLSFNFSLLFIWMNSNGIVRQTLNGIWINETCHVMLASCFCRRPMSITLHFFHWCFCLFSSQTFWEISETQKVQYFFGKHADVKKLPDLYFVMPAKIFNTCFASVKIFWFDLWKLWNKKMRKIRIVKKGCIEKGKSNRNSWMIKLSFSLFLLRCFKRNLLINAIIWDF